MKKYFNLIFFFLLFFSCSQKLFGWIYPEHRDIAILAIQKLNPEYRSSIDRIWSEARKGHETRLTDSVIDVNQSTDPKQLDFASWPAIAGDHSCSSENLLNNVLQTDWILKVADVAAELKIDLVNAKSKSQLINAIRDSDIKLQRADIEYASRAGSNNAHFLLARPEVNSDTKKYLESCLATGNEINALGIYSWLHTSAMYKASRYFDSKDLSNEERSKLILSALSDEAFAIHFLEDVYAAGHTAGTWGNASLRKGTHDFYNENGLEVVTWDEKRMILMGDAYMKNENAEIVADNIRLSLEQFIDAATGKNIIDFKKDSIELINSPDSFNVCQNNFLPPRKYNKELLGEVLVKTPVPALATGKGELPRFRSELGSFIGVSASLNAMGMLGGFGKEQTSYGTIGGLEGNVRFGFGMDGVLNEAGDGLVYFQFGWREDASSTNEFANTGINVPAGAITAAIPGRSGYNLRLRLPFWLIPGDLLIAGPILLLISPKTLAKMAITSGNGGVIPWQTGIATGIGRFQFILGREIGVSFYGLQDPLDVILIPTSSTSVTFLEYRSTKIDLPILEYRPFRTFSSDQSTSIEIQLTSGFDIPFASKVLYPDVAPTPELKTVFYFGARVTFNWRHYIN